MKRPSLIFPASAAQAGACVLAAMAMSGALVLAGLCLGAGPAHAQEEPRGPGILREIRNRVSGRDPAEVWQEARRKSKAADALPMMENLAGRGRNSPYAGSAALWLGHYHYGSGAIPTARGYFDLAAERVTEEEERDEARFWAAQCRNLLGEAMSASESRSPRTVPGVLAEIARHDGELRVGEFNAAMAGYLALEGVARQVGSLGPLLYRVGLAAASSSGGGGRLPFDWDLIRRWEPATPTSPERALVSALAATSAEAPGSVPPVEEPAGAGRSESDFAQEPSPSPGDTSSGGISSEGDSVLGSTEPEAGAAARGERGEEVAPQAPTESAAAYSVQLGAFRDRERARSEMERLVGRGLSVRLERETSDGTEYFKIRLGKSASREEAEDLARRLCQGLDWQIVRITP